jgi:hypothetical protein
MGRRRHVWLRQRHMDDSFEGIERGQLSVRKTVVQNGEVQSRTGDELHDAFSRIRISDWNAVHPEGRVFSRAALILDASALWRGDPPVIAKISPASNSCFSSLSRSYARYSSYV